MNLIKKIGWPAIYLIIMIPVGCGYHLIGTGSGTAGKSAGNIAIPVFENNSSEPGIERSITARVREAFIQDGRLKLMSKQEASLIFTGDLKRYELRPVSFDNNDNVTEYWVIMNIDVKVRDTENDKYLVNQMFRSKWDYKVTSEVLSSERARINAIDEASRDFAQKMIGIIIDGF